MFHNQLIAHLSNMSSREEIITRHKKESKDLIATITGLKKQATKKTRRNVVIKCTDMQADLDRKQKNELQEFDFGIEDEEVTPEELIKQLEIDNVTGTIENDANVTEKDGDVTEKDPSETSSTSSSFKPKRNRQKERLLKRQAEIDKIKYEASIEASNTIDYRQIEIDSMNQILSLNSLKVQEIKPDGHCLFASIQDQLLLRHQVSKDIETLRNLAGEYISKHRDDFIPFLFDEVTCEVKDIDAYIAELTTTAMWGSDMEILALAKYFDCPISIYIAGSSTIVINEEGEEPKLMLGYYKHSYGLGEHYNSLRDMEI